MNLKTDYTVWDHTSCETYKRIEKARKNRFLQWQLNYNVALSSSVVYFNCQGYLNNKDNIMVMIRDWRPRLVFLSEIHVTAEVERVELDVEGYCLEQCVRNNKRTGGLLVLVRNDIKYKVKSVQSIVNYVWYLSVEIYMSRVKYLFTVLYHPPQTENARFVDFFKGYLDEISAIGGVSIIMGDFNFDLMKETFYGEKLLSEIYSSGFSQVVDAPTRVTDRSATLIDYVVTNTVNLGVQVHLTPDESPDIIMHFRSMKHYDRDKIQDYFLNTTWNSDTGDVNVFANDFVIDIETILNSICPKRVSVIKPLHLNKAWISEDLRENMRIRDNLYFRDDEAWGEYKKVRNYIVKQIKLEK